MRTSNESTARNAMSFTIARRAPTWPSTWSNNKRASTIASLALITFFLRRPDTAAMSMEVNTFALFPTMNFSGAEMLALRSAWMYSGALAMGTAASSRKVSAGTIRDTDNDFVNLSSDCSSSPDTPPL